MFFQIFSVKKLVQPELKCFYFPAPQTLERNPFQMIIERNLAIQTKTYIQRPIWEYYESTHAWLLTTQKKRQKKNIRF